MESSLVPEYASQLENVWFSVSGQIEDTSKKTYLHDIRFFVSWMFQKDVTPDRLTYDHMVEYRAYLLERYANSTAARMFSVVRRILQEQVFKKQLTFNPTDGIRPIRSEDETTHMVLTNEEAERLLNAVDIQTLKGKRDYVMLLLLLRLGLRRSECIGIDVTDIGMEQGHNILIIRHGKGRKRRVNKIPVDVKREIDVYLNARQAEGCDAPPLFVNVLKNDKPGDTRLTDKQVYRIVKQYAQKSGVEKLSPHGLRGTFITLSLEADAPLHKVQYAVGHKDPRTTERYQKRKMNLDENAVDFVKVKRKQD